MDVVILVLNKANDCFVCCTMYMYSDIDKTDQYLFFTRVCIQTTRAYMNNSSAANQQYKYKHTTKVYYNNGIEKQLKTFPRPTKASLKQEI